ncbi:MAG: RNA polymerase sigma factor (sigma-70 family) [Candidatus Paceibacteria bacterium]|jgi:RNA polymerase sigma factor (sigma-70 family)
MTVCVRTAPCTPAVPMFSAPSTAISHSSEANAPPPVRELTLGDLQLNPGSFAEAYSQNYDRITGYVFRRVGRRHDCEDIVSDVFLSAYWGFARARRTKAPVRFWLLTIATNRVNRWLKRSASNEVLPLDGCASAPAPATDNTMLEGTQREVHRALLSLAPKHQDVLALHYLEGLPIAEVAQVVGCRAGTVKSRLSRARCALLQVLDSEQIG